VKLHIVGRGGEREELLKDLEGVGAVSAAAGCEVRCAELRVFFWEERDTERLVLAEWYAN
jgi:hypothetical protein